MKSKIIFELDEEEYKMIFDLFSSLNKTNANKDVSIFCKELLLKTAKEQKQKDEFIQKFKSDFSNIENVLNDLTKSIDLKGLVDTVTKNINNPTKKEESNEEIKDINKFYNN